MSFYRFKLCCVHMSQPSWAAWIEIIDISDAELALAVAALLGCVD